MEVEGHEFYCIKSKCLKGCVAQGETVDEALKLFEELEQECIKTSKSMAYQFQKKSLLKILNIAAKFY